MRDTCLTPCVQDTDSVVNSLETGLGMLIHFVFIALYLLVWGVNIVQVSHRLGVCKPLTVSYSKLLKGAGQLAPAPCTMRGGTCTSTTAMHAHMCHSNCWKVFNAEAAKPGAEQH